MSSTASGMVSVPTRWHPSRSFRHLTYEMVVLLESSHRRVFGCYPNDRKGPSPQSLASSITASVISKALACDWL